MKAVARTTVAAVGLSFAALTLAAPAQARPLVGADDWRVQLGADDWRVQLGADDWRVQLGADDWRVQLGADDW